MGMKLAAVVAGLCIFSAMAIPAYADVNVNGGILKECVNVEGGVSS
ncbi:MAG TPA: hypothetical protein VJT32_01570 [bacterium]|nr:hypothetical protein [bacterium]